MSGYTVRKWNYPFYSLNIPPGGLYQRTWDLVSGDMGRVINVIALPYHDTLYGRFVVFTQYSMGIRKFVLSPGNPTATTHIYADFRNAGPDIVRAFSVNIWHSDDLVNTAAVAHAPERLKTAIEHDANGNIQSACLYAEGSPIPSAANERTTVTHIDTPSASIAPDKHMPYLANLVDTHRINPEKAGASALIRR